MFNKSPHHMLSKFIKDKDGKIVLWQFPNIPLAGWILFTLVELLMKHGRIHTGFHGLAQASLFAWAYMELKMGDSIFRQTLGGFVLLGLIIGFFK
jgi:hypothetical protein